MKFAEVLTSLDAFLWGGMLAFLVLAFGIFLTVKFKFIQGKRLREALCLLFKRPTSEVGEISPFAALCTTLSATIGTGNIIGVATAIATGGPGALLWMELSAFFGMAIKYFEGYLAVKYRKTENGRTRGGPFYYIEKGMGKAFLPLAYFFALSGLISTLFGMGTLIQSNSIADGLCSFFAESNNEDFIHFENVSFSSVSVLSALVVALLAGVIISGGLKRISRISEFLVPAMTFIYITACLVIIIGRIEKLPSVVYLVIKTAFCPSAVFGAASGITVREALRWGVSGGVFTNEAGLGISAIADGEAKCDSSENQGLVSMTAVFFDTTVMCTLTGLAVLITDSINIKETGALIAQNAFMTGLPLNEKISAFILTACLCFFAFSTITGYCHYGEECLLYITKGKFTKLYRILYIAAVFSGPLLSVPVVWTLARVLNAMMALPNLLALFYLSMKEK